MRYIRVLLISLVCALAMLPARAAWAAVAVNIVEPLTSRRYDQAVHVRAEVSSTLQVARVLAQLGGGSALLTNTGGPIYEADISVFGVPHGEHVLTVTATDVAGASASAQRAVFIDARPTVQILAPKHEIVAHPMLRVAASCVDDHPEDCLVQVFADIQDGTRTTVELARGTPAVDTVVDLSAFDGKPIDLRFGAVDIWTSQRLRGPRVYVEASPLLTAVDEVPGRILDFDASRILFVTPEMQLAVLDRSTRAITPFMTVPYPYRFDDSLRAFLTRTGAVMEVPVLPDGSNRSPAVYEWRDGALLRLAEHGVIASVSGDYMAYSGAGTYLRNLASGTDELVLGTALEPFNFDVAQNGLLTYADPRSWLYKHMAGTSTLLVRSGDKITRPATDGLNVVFTKHIQDNVYQTLVVTPSGEVPLGVAPLPPPGGTETAAYQIHDGYIAFLQGTFRSEQVWLRTPTGEKHQLSFFATASRLADPPGRRGHGGISDAGEVMFLNPPRRYLGAPGAAPRDISSQLGHARWFDGAWYVVIGNTLFLVDDGSSGAGGEGGSGGGAGGAGSFAGDVISFAGDGDAVQVGSFDGHGGAGGAGASSPGARAGTSVDISSTGVGGADSGVSSSAEVASSEPPVGEPPMAGGCAVAARRPGLDVVVLATLALAMAARARARRASGLEPPKLSQARDVDRDLRFMHGRCPHIQSIVARPDARGYSTVPRRGADDACEDEDDPGSSRCAGLHAGRVQRRGDATERAHRAHAADRPDRHDGSDRPYTARG
ncbi:hypothetical protein [Sorangium sp. So ce1335]|uniref:hypothetical protein n=1 Tax=Sorangium sp. So ce1335 TaxID=3133335 RepID=UPI003F603947